MCCAVSTEHCHFLQRHIQASATAEGSEGTGGWSGRHPAPEALHLLFGHEK